VIPSSRAPLRDRYNAFITDHEVAWELLMAALAVVFIVAGYAADNASSGEGAGYWALETALTVLFAAEFSSRIWASRDRRGYLRGHWIDLVAIVPTVPGAKLLRLLRLLRLIRVFAGVYRALTSLQRLAGQRSLIWLFSAWLGVAVICSAAMFIAESGVNPNVKSPADALWWGIVTLTTVGYGDISPITPEGRFAAGALMILGITLFAATTGTIASFLISAQQASQRGVPERLRELRALHLEQLVTDQEFEAKRAELVQAL